MLLCTHVLELIHVVIETFFVTYDMLESLQKECISFLDSYTKTCMIFGILLNIILLIEISCSIFLLFKYFHK
jgi:hypothetical protein